MYDPKTKEEKQAIGDAIRRNLAGTVNSGNLHLTFADGKDNSPILTQMEPQKLDKSFLGLTDTIQRQLCYAHQIDPQLLGLKTPGSLGNSGEFLYAFNLFNQSVIQPSQKILENIFNSFLSVNGIPTKIKFNDADISKLNPNINANTK